MSKHGSDYNERKIRPQGYVDGFITDFASGAIVMLLINVIALIV